MRQATALTFVFAGLLAAVAVVLGKQMLEADEPPTLTWNTKDEVEVATADPIDAADGDIGNDSLRERLGEATADDAALDERTPLLLRGRVVDRFQRAVPGANVFLDFGRGGPRGGPMANTDSRRVPDPVQSDAEGRFAFKGQTFRNLRVSLLVTHQGHAPSWFDRNLGEVKAEMDLGDLVVVLGGDLTGRVTDLDGNGIGGASVQLQPENGNRMRFRRDQELLPPATADGNGYFRLVHVATGDWTVAATAAHHQRGTTDTVTVADEQVLELADIRLGPGYELAGIVSDAGGQPIADAEVSARAQPGDDGGGPGGPGGGRRGGRGPGGPFGGMFGGNDQRTRTDAKGHFFLEHLPGTSLELSVRKTGFLNHREDGIDARTGATIYVTLQAGLQISGAVSDARTAAPVEQFTVRAERLRGLPGPDGAGTGGNDWVDALQQLRADGGDRGDMRARFRGDNGGPGGPGRRGRDRFENHAGGRFRETGLQEGVYAVVVESAAHATYRSGELELRLGAAAPELQIALVEGLSVAGFVRGDDGAPIANADVELRAAELPTDANASGRNRRGGGGGGPGGGRGRGGDAVRAFFGNFASTNLTAKTDREGHFAIAHAAAGSYRVVANATGHAESRTEPFELAASRDDIALVLGTLARLTGHVLAATPAELAEVRVVAIPAGDSPNIGAMFRGGSGRPFANVSGDGTYRFDELTPGAYAVRAVMGENMRDLFAEFTAGPMVADVVVKAGEAARFDVALTRSQAGSVSGSVLHNGSPATGFHVALRRQDEAAANAPSDRGGFRRGMNFGRDYSATVDNQGQFQIKDVPPGTYQLTVGSDRRSGTLRTETVDVHAQAMASVAISLFTATVDGTIAIADGTPIADVDGAVFLLADATEVPTDLGDLRRNGTLLRSRVQDGKFVFDAVPPGNYLAVLTVRGRERTSAQVVPTLGQHTTLSLPLGKVSTDDPNAPAANAASGNPSRGPGGRGGNGARGGGNGGNGGNGNPTDPAAPAPRRQRRGQ